MTETEIGNFWEAAILSLKFEIELSLALLLILALLLMAIYLLTRPGKRHDD